MIRRWSEEPSGGAWFGAEVIEAVPALELESGFVLLGAPRTVRGGAGLAAPFADHGGGGRMLASDPRGKHGVATGDAEPGEGKGEAESGGTGFEGAGGHAGRDAGVRVDPAMDGGEGVFAGGKGLPLREGSEKEFEATPRIVPRPGVGIRGGEEMVERGEEVGVSGAQPREGFPFVEEERPGEPRVGERIVGAFADQFVVLDEAVVRVGREGEGREDERVDGGELQEWMVGTRRLEAGQVVLDDVVSDDGIGEAREGVEELESGGGGAAAALIAEDGSDVGDAAAEGDLEVDEQAAMEEGDAGMRRARRGGCCVFGSNLRHRGCPGRYRGRSGAARGSCQFPDARCPQRLRRTGRGVPSCQIPDARTGNWQRPQRLRRTSHRGHCNFGWALGIAVAVGGIEVRSMKTARRNAWHGSVLLGLWLGSGSGSVLAQDHWEVQSADLLGVTSASGLLVAVDSAGGTRLSRDGVDWFRCDRVSDQPLRAVAHGAGRFVAAGDYGTVVTSTDGLGWAPQVSGTDVHLLGAAYGAGRFVVAGEIGRVRSSEDGMNWTRRLSGTGELLTTVSYLDGRFVAVGGNYAVVRSDDGLTWMNTGAGGNRRLNGIAYGNGVYVAVGTQGYFAVSENGINWDSQTGPATMDLRKVTFGGGVFVALGSESTSDGHAVYRSVDGRTWSLVVVKGSAVLNDVVYADGRFLAVGEAGAVAESTDGANWTLLRFGTRAWLRGVAYGRGRWVAVGEAGLIQTSEDGAQWDLRRADPNTRNVLQAVASGNEGFIAVQRQAGVPDGGRILQSSDGREWTVRMTASVGFNGVVRGATAWVAVGVKRDGSTGLVQGVVSRSVDGVSWSAPVVVPGAGELTAVTGSDGRFVAVGSGGVVVTSEDGVTWEARNSGVTVDLLAVAAGDDGYVATGTAGTIVGSSDGLTWSPRSSGVSMNLSAITWARGAYVAVGDEGGIVVSRNGVDWVGRASGVGSRLSGVGFGGGQYVAVGDTGTVVSSAFEPEDGVELSMPERTPIGGVRFQVLGRADGAVVAERTSDLKSWVAVREFGLGELPGSVVDGNGPVGADGVRYYRVRRLPGL